MEVLESLHPLLYRMLSDPEVPRLPDLEPRDTESGLPTLKFAGLYVHSPRDPEREGEKLAGAFLAESPEASGGDEGTVLVLGFGLGYAVEALAALAGDRPLVVVERREILRLALETRDLRDLLRRPKLAFVPGLDGGAVVEALSGFLKPGADRSPRVFSNRTLVERDRPGYAEVESRVRAWAGVPDVNDATLGKFGRRMRANLRRNGPILAKLPGIADLRRHLDLSGFPAFLAAAGPSLDTFAGILPEIHKRAPIVAVDTALRFFASCGVEPDFVVVADPQYWNARHLDGLALPGNTRSVLVVDAASYPSVFRLRCAGLVVSGSPLPEAKFLGAGPEDKGRLGSGGSVATGAWDLCRFLGAGKIWIGGLDLAFARGRTHYRGALFQEAALASADRFRPAQTAMHAAFRSGGPFPVPAANGRQVLGDRRLSFYAAWFAAAFAADPRTVSVRLRLPDDPGESLAVPGLGGESLESFLALPERRPEIDRLLREALARMREEGRGIG